MSGTHPAGMAGNHPSGARSPRQWEADVIETVERGEEILVRHYGFVHGRYRNVEEMRRALGEEIFSKVQLRGE